jgi:hypothetical protein
MVRKRISFEVTLLNSRRDLYQLWEEHEFGISGRNPARRFNAL